MWLNASVRRGLTALPTLVAAAALLLAAPALAHTYLVSAEPADAETVTGEISEIRLEFNDPVDEPEVEVTDPSGADVTDGGARSEDTTVIQPLAALTEHGEHTVGYRVIAPDGHVIADEHTFVYEGPVEEPDEAAVEAPATIEPPAPAEPGPVDDDVTATDEPLIAADELVRVGALQALLVLIAMAAVMFAIGTRATSGARDRLTHSVTDDRRTG